MELTEKTMQVLKNYATINPNIVITEGNVIKTVSEAKNVLSSVELDVSFPQTFGIYELSEFLSVLSLVDSPRLKFEDTYVLVTDSAGRSRIKYFYSDIYMLTTPSKDIIMPETEVKFTLDTDTLSRLKRAASVLGHDEISITNEGKRGSSVKLTVVDKDDATSNSFFSFVEGEFEEGVDFNFIMNVNNLKIVNEDFQVGISKKLISNFKSLQSPIEYFIALEKSSTYGE